MPRFPLADQICWRDTVHESRMCLLPQGYWPARQIFVEAARTTPPTHEAQCALSPSATIGPVSRPLSGSFVSPMQSVRASDDRSEEHRSELRSLMRISYAVLGLNKQNTILR